jgi:hypothetical protein
LELQEIFPFGTSTIGNISIWVYWKYFHLELQLLEIFPFGTSTIGNIRNPGNIRHE